MPYKYRQIKFNDSMPDVVNNLGADGWRIISVNDSVGETRIIMENIYPTPDPAEKDLMPVARTIGDPNALYRCMDGVKRYEWSHLMEPAEFITFDELFNDDFYSDYGEYEMYISDGFYFLGTDISCMTRDEVLELVSKNKDKFRDGNDLKVYYIDYPEDK